MLNIESIGERFTKIVNSAEWGGLQEKYNNCDDIYVLGHGGNMGVADHTAVDMTRLSNGTKNAMCPGSCVVATSLINDTSFDQWMVEWLKHRTSTRTRRQLQRSLVYGISSSGKSKDVINALLTSNIPPTKCFGNSLPLGLANTKVLLSAFDAPGVPTGASNTK